MRKHESGNRKRSLGWKPGAGKLEVNVTVDSEHLRKPTRVWLHDHVLKGWGVACSTPPVVDNAFISENEKIGNYSEGDIVYYTCHPGYISRGRLRYKCQDEEWTQSRLLKCTPCSTPPVVDNAFISENEKIGNYSEGDIVYYTCHPGYISRGRLRYKCQDEEWTQSRLLKCTPKPCGHPGDIINGRFHLVNNTEFLYGVQVKYTCNEGYQMASQMDFRVCLDNGWSNDVPHCEGKFVG
ncbi:UNVERIFIED_CONTAM: hypothetical protein FKN15_072277 [Acipenser sinensis]